jgi:hypothetical protein
MKNIFYRILQALTIVTAGVFSASVSAEPSATHKRCIAKAGDVYQICRDMKREYRNDDDCDAKLDRQTERCMRDYDEAANSRFKTDGLDSNGRFQPIIIPRR